jgi:hypothetical protein
LYPSGPDEAQSFVESEIIRFAGNPSGHRNHLAWLSADIRIWNGGCSCYVNSYLANGAVIVPGYGYDRDLAAVETYKRLYSNREIVQVRIDNIALGGGGVHCITQQQPAV